MAVNDNFMLPLWLRKMEQMEDLLQVEQNELSKLSNTINILESQLIINTCTFLISRWEMICGITSEPEKNLAERRIALQSKLNTRGTATINALKELAQLTTGQSCDIIEQPELYRFLIRLEYKEDTTSLYRALDEVKPAHLLYILQKILHFSISEYNRIALAELKIHISINNWYQFPTTFNGSKEFDGEIQWDQRIFARLFSLLRIQAGIQTDCSNSFTLLFPFHFAERNTSIFLFCTRSGFWNRSSVRFRPLTIRSQAKTKGAVSARLITNKDFKFNGIAAWNGAKKFNSGAVIDL